MCLVIRQLRPSMNNDHSLPLGKISNNRNWSNQELAEFYRVHDILGRMGWSVEIDQGWTDEGEPWLVFCDANNGDVIAHFAKIDGKYILASRHLAAPLEGKDFSELIGAFTARYPVVTP